MNIQDVNYKYSLQMQREDGSIGDQYLDDNNIKIGLEEHEIREFERDMGSASAIRNIKIEMVTYYVRLCEEIYERLEEKWREFKCVGCLAPENIIRATRLDANQCSQYFKEVVKRFPTLRDIDTDPNELILQWDEVVSILKGKTFSEPFLKYIGNVKIDIFWSIFFKTRERFAKLWNFIKVIIGIPHSNAAAERAWSKEGKILRDDRNKLSDKVIRALMLLSEATKECGGILEFSPTEEMVKMINKKDYNKKIDFENMCIGREPILP